MVRSKRKMRPLELLEPFADMCRVSRAPDGDWQGDGWGIATEVQSSKFKIRKWDVYKSLRPIWEEQNTFHNFQETNIFIVHSRSAGFPEHKGVLAYNQPYVSDQLAYVFNGMIRSVSLPMKFEGSIGAQKIFSLISLRLQDKGLDGVLLYVRDVIRENARRVEGMNIGLIVGERLYALCDYEHNADYFSLRYYNDGELSMVCSEPVGEHKWHVMRKGEILSL